MLKMEEFNINELAGATGLILGAVSGILVVIFKSRCYCKFRIGCSDKFNLCMCERKPPPDKDDSDDEIKGLKDQAKKLSKKEDEILEEQKTPRLIPVKSNELEPEPEIEKIV
jgi:hypothetical protein